jgi:hypothetical protein
MFSDTDPVLGIEVHLPRYCQCGHPARTERRFIVSCAVDIAVGSLTKPRNFSLP